MHLHDSWQSSHISKLLHSWEEATMATTAAEGLQLIKDQAFQIGVHIADARHPHVGHESRRYLVLHGADAPNELQLLHRDHSRDGHLPAAPLGAG